MPCTKAAGAYHTRASSPVLQLALTLEGAHGLGALPCLPASLIGLDEHDGLLLRQGGQLWQGARLWQPTHCVLFPQGRQELVALIQLLKGSCTIYPMRLPICAFAYL